MTFYQGDEILDEIMYEIINNSFSEKHIESIEDWWKVTPIFQLNKHQEYSRNEECISMDYFTCSESEGSAPVDSIVSMVAEKNYTQDCQEQYTKNGSGTAVKNEELNHVKNAPSRSMGNCIWKPLPKNLQPCAMYSPKSVQTYILMNHFERRRCKNATKVRSHLLALGWQIQHNPFRGYERFRYISPEREVYFSLHKICEQLVKQGTQNCSNSISRGSQVVQTQIHLEGNTSLNRGAETECWDSEQDISIVDEKGCTTETIMNVVSHRPGLCRRKDEFDGLNASVKKVYSGDPFQQYGSTCMNPASVETRSGCQMENCVDGPYINTSSKRMSPTSLSYLIDNCMMSMGDKACYYNKKQNIVMKEGSITREGILCSCCGNVYSISKFEVHAGSNKHRPAANIILENGKSLLELQTLVKQVTG